MTLAGQAPAWQGAWAHERGSPWWFAATPDGGFHVGICEYRSGLFRIYTASSKDAIQIGNGHLECTESRLRDAKDDGWRRITEMSRAALSRATGSDL